MKTTITKNDLLTKDLTHKYGGNGYMMIEDIDSEYCRITMSGPISLHRFQAFMAWKPCLSVSRQQKDFKDPESPIVDVEISPETFDQVQKLRAEIKAGHYFHHGYKTGEGVQVNKTGTLHFDGCPTLDCLVGQLRGRRRSRIEGGIERPPRGRRHWPFWCR